MQRKEVRGMPAVLAINEAKQRLPELVREASETLRVFPVANARRRDAKRAHILGEGALEALLTSFQFCPKWQEDQEQGLWTVYLPEIDVFGQGETKEEASTDLVAAAEDYARLFLDDAPFYLRVGRKGQFPYVLKIGLALTMGADLGGVLGV